MPSGRIQRLSSYTALYRVAARPYLLSTTTAGAGRVQLATIHHAAASQFKVELRNVWVALDSATAASVISVDLARISTAPVTGNPAITPSVIDPREPADTDTICLALPTTPGTEGAILYSATWDLGITGAASTAAPPPPLNYLDLLAIGQAGFSPDELAQMPVIRPGNLEGYSVTLDVNAVDTVKALVLIKYTRAAYAGNQG